MSKGVWHTTIVDNRGNVIPNASVRFEDAITGDLVSIYSDADGTPSPGNPKTANAFGFIEVYLDPWVRLKITATGGGSTQVWNDEMVPARFLQSGTGAVSRSIESKLKDTISVKDFGAVGDGVTDDTSAINLAFARLRVLQGDDTFSERNPVSLVFPPGTYLCSGSIRATQLRGHGWSIDFDGAEIFSTTTGKVSIDFLHSRFGTINNMVIRSDSSNKPLVGCQVGYISHNVSSGSLTFNDCYIIGNFTRTAFYNGGCEGIIKNNCRWWNEESDSSSYALIDDSANYWKRTSDFVTGDLVTVDVTGITNANPAVVTAPGHVLGNGDQIRIDNVAGMTDVNGVYYEVANASGDTFELSGINSSTFGTYTSGGDVARVETYSFTMVEYRSCSFVKPNGGFAIWKGWSSSSHRYRNCYAVVGSGETGMDLVFDPVNSVAQYHQNLYLDMRFETTGISSCIKFNRITDGSVNISNFTFRESLAFAVDQLFESTSNSGNVQINNMDVQVDIYQSVTPDLFSDVAKFANSTGKISSNLALTSITGIPSEFRGDLVTRTGIRSYGTQRLLGTVNTQTSHTGDTSETVLGTITVPANSIGPNGFLEIDAHFTFTGTNTKNARIRLNGLAGTVYASYAITTQTSLHTISLIYNRNSTSSQCAAGATVAYSPAASGFVTSSIDTTAAVDIVFTGVLTNSGESIALEASSVRVAYKD